MGATGQHGPEILFENGSQSRSGRLRESHTAILPCIFRCLVGGRVLHSAPLRYRQERSTNASHDASIGTCMCYGRHEDAGGSPLAPETSSSRGWRGRRGPKSIRAVCGVLVVVRSTDMASRAVARVDARIAKGGTSCNHDCKITFIVHVEAAVKSKVSLRFGWRSDGYPVLFFDWLVFDHDGAACCWRL